MKGEKFNESPRFGISNSRVRQGRIKKTKYLRTGGETKDYYQGNTRLQRFTSTERESELYNKRHPARTMQDDNPFSWMEYTGDRIGLIHIAALIPHFGRKKKRKS